MKTNGGTITNDSVNNNKDNKSDMNDIIPKLAVNNTLLNKSNNNDDVGISDINKEIIGNGVSIETFDTSSRMESLLQEFTNLYTNKLNRINGETQPTDAASLQKKISILEAWVEDLGEQNSVLVSTVEQLEKEARHRVQLLQEKLDKMAVVTKDSCISIRDHQVQVNSLISQKISAEEDAQNLRNQILSLEHRNLTLQQENSDLKDDLDSLIDVIGRVRASGKLEIDEISLKFLHPDRLTGSNSSLSGKQLVERRPADGRKSRRRSTSPVEFPGLAEEDSNQKLRSEIQMLRETKQQTNTLLLQRDQHIADLQAQLTVLHRQLTISQKQVDETTSALQSMKHRGRRDTLEICRRDDVIRHLLSPNHFEVRSEPVSLTEDDLETKGNVDLELQLNSSIDVLTARVTDLEEECQQLRHQNTVLKSAHTHCAPTINQLQDRLNNSHLSIEDLRTVLTAEVAERHDQLLSLRSQLHETRQKHTECLLQLQMKSDIIKQLTEQINSLKIIKSDKKGVGGASSEDTTSQCTQTEQRDNNKVDNEAQDANGEYILSLTLKISKLDNELSEKNILMRELQNHLSNSRQELLLKDKTLMNVEQKLDITRRSYDEKEDRMNYLTSQLTCLQLEVSRLHGTAQQLRLQLENRSTLVKKLEAENESLIWQLNDKSSMTEKFRDQTAIYESEIEKRKKELSEYKVTIGTLQDALVATKQTCDKLRKQYDTEVTGKVEKTDTQEVGTRVHSADQQQLVLKLKGQLEDAKVQSKLLEEKCKQMEKAHESEFANFVSRLVQTHDQRLRRLQETLYSCSRNYLHCYDDSKILLKLKAVIEDLSHYLQDAHQMVLSAESDRCQIMGSAQRGIPLQSSAPTKKIEEGVFRTETGIKDLSYNDSIIEGTLPRLKLNGTSKKMNVSTRLEKDEVERGWSDQLDNRLELETSVAEDKLKKLTNEAADLKRYNDILDNQLSVSQSQAEALRSRLASLETQLQEQKIAYELLSTDANIVGGSGCYCSHHQRRASSNLLENVQPKTKPIQPFEEVKTLLKCSACHNFRRHISCERLRKEFVNNGLPTHRHPHGACGSMHTNNDHIDGCGHTEGNHHLERDCTPGYSKKVSEWGSVNRANSGAASDTPVDVIQQTACVLEYL